MARKQSAAAPATNKRARHTEADSLVKDPALRANSTSSKSSRQREIKSIAAEKRAWEPQGGTITFPVVGIGASAGGLEAFRQFLDHLPGDATAGSIVADATPNELMRRTVGFNPRW